MKLQEATGCITDCVAINVPEGSVVGVVGQSADENNAFIKITQHFTLRKLPVPHIFAVAKDGMRYLQTDLGNRTLYEALQKDETRVGDTP